MLTVFIFPVVLIVGAAASDKSPVYIASKIDSVEQSSRHGFGKNGFIPLPWIPARTPAVISPCTNRTLGAACLCGVAVCASSQYCTLTDTGSVCHTLGICPQPPAFSQLSCACGTIDKICNNTQVCVNAECVTPLLTCPAGNITAMSPCPCGAERNICTTGQICTNATSMCSPTVISTCQMTPFNYASYMPCICSTGGAGSMTCRVGQLCDTTTSTMPRCEPAPCVGTTIYPCLCGTTFCKEGQTCQGTSCDPPTCLSDGYNVRIPCICGRVTQPCTIGQRCAVDALDPNLPLTCLQGL